MTLEKQIEDILESALLEKGFGIVRLQLQGSGRQTLQILIERLDEGLVSIDDCVDVSHLASALLDVEDPIPGAYTLEVGSAGLDRPLTKLSDFDRFKGSMAKINLKALVEGQRRFHGLLQGTEGETIRIECPSPEDPSKFDVAELAFSDIQKAKIIPDYDQPGKHDGKK